MLYSFYRYLKVYKVFSVRKNIKQDFFAGFYVQILIRAGNIWEPLKKKLWSLIFSKQIRSVKSEPDLNMEMKHLDSKKWQQGGYKMVRSRIVYQLVREW